MEFTGDAGFFASPFPSDQRVTDAGTPNVTGFPNPEQDPLAALVLQLATAGLKGAGLTSSIYFSFDGPLSAELPTPQASTMQGASVFLIDVDPSSPHFGDRPPVEALFMANGGPYGAANLLAVLPFQGVPLEPSTRYAAVVLSSLKDERGDDVCAAPAMAELAQGKQPAGMSAAAFDEVESSLSTLKSLRVNPSDIAAISVFTTEDPTADYVKVLNAMLALPVPQISAPFLPTTEVYPTYCVFQTTIPMPEYQGGTSPYTYSGGGWVFDDAGAPVLQGAQEANFVVTIPRIPMPPDGYPIVNMSRTGAGGNRPLVDRGTEATNGGPSITPGTGPALYFAAAGFAGASIDGPLGGLRNPDAPNWGEEDYTIFNVTNPLALRDNLRQSAVELSLTASILASLTFDASSCPGVTTPDNGPIKFDSTKFALFSHSMGSTISPMTLAFDPRYKVAILSGAGGSWIENVVYKLLPMPLLPDVDLLLLINPNDGYQVGEGDPMLNMFQWLEEAADAPVFDGRTVQHPEAAPPRSVLKVQGIIDHYILPNICNTTTLSLGLDLAGPELDTEPMLSMYTPLENVLDLSGRSKIALPAAGNVKLGNGDVATAVVTQHPSDGIEDGHEVIFQTDPPKHEYECLLASFAAGQTPTVPAPTDAGAIAPCTE
jgi:hypothetical protein